MCGIAATTRKDVSMERALEALSCRGPDGRAIESYPVATLAQTRLAIIDLSSGGRQPKRDNARDIAITFNGEIYNYRELRSELEEKGHRFSSESDTEVILKAYLEWGEECLVHLDGMFAFVLADNEQGRLFLARDRFGKKPLYYHLDAEKQLFAASEIKALIAMGIKPEIDPAGLDAYLALMYLPPWRTVYTNVQTLPPAHAAVYERGAFRSWQYWKLERRSLTISYDDAKIETKRLIEEAVKKRMLASDVEVGAFLSGGVDSTLITAYAQEVMQKPVKTFSLGYGDYINELPFADEAARAIGTDHHTLQAHASLTEELEHVIAYFDEPHGDSADLAQHLLSRETAKHVKVALAGDGGDELFMGYGWYFAHWNKPKLQRLADLLAVRSPWQGYYTSTTVFSPRERDALLRSPVAHESLDILAGEGAGIEKINQYDLTTYLPGQLLTKVDRTSMMHSLEVRCPLLDHRLAEFIVNLPTEYKCSRSTGKILLKDLLAEIMPRKFVDRKKQGFGAPVRKWLGEESFRRFVNEKLGRGAYVHEYLRPEAVARTLERGLSGYPKYSYQLWVLLSLELWLRTR